MSLKASRIVGDVPTLGMVLVMTLSFLARIGSAFGADIDWRWSHPRPHGNNLSDMVHRNGLYAHVTDHGGLYVSTNRVLWQRLATGTRKDLRAAAFLGSRLVVTGEEGTVLWSDDGARVESGEARPATDDWFEGVAAGGDVAVAVGDRGAIYRSADGRSWDRVADGLFSEWLSGVAFGVGLFVAVGEGGVILSSPDANAWTLRRSGVSTDLTRVVFGDGRFLAVGRNGVVLSSSNGTVWLPDPSPGATAELSTAALAPGERLVSGDLTIALRRAPGGWEDQLSPGVSPSPAPEWNYAASLWDGSRFLVGGRTGVLVESYRTNMPPFENETFWIRQDDSPRNWLWDVARVGGAYLAVGDQATVLSSLSGAEWGLESVPESVEGKVLYGVGGSPDWGLAAGEGGTLLRSRGGFTEVKVTNQVVVGGSTRSVVSTNRVSLMGLVWEVVEPSPTTNTLQGVGWDGTRFLVVGGGGTVLSGTDGTNWTRTTVSGGEFLSSVAASDGQWVATGARGAIYTSSDGATWNPRNSGTTNWVYRVARAGPEWLAVGERGTILASPDGEAWVPRTSGTTSWLTGIRTMGDVVYLCGTQGTVLRSTNRIDWESVPTLTGKALNGIASRGSQVIVAGAEGVILRGIAEPGLSPVNIMGYRQFRDGEGPGGVEVLSFDGILEQRFRWESGDTLGEWDLEAELELDADGMAVVGRPTGGPRRFHRTATVPP
ncbi:MAG: WD40/YVTN/BNR-like repeat-containing protein [Limisphaerales bacterium]